VAFRNGLFPFWVVIGFGVFGVFGVLQHATLFKKVAFRNGLFPFWVVIGFGVFGVLGVFYFLFFY
jgi:hypothetical protein